MKSSVRKIARILFVKKIPVTARMDVSSISGGIIATIVLTDGMVMIVTKHVLEIVRVNDVIDTRVHAPMVAMITLKVIHVISALQESLGYRVRTTAHLTVETGATKILVYAMAVKGIFRVIIVKTVKMDTV